MQTSEISIESTNAAVSKYTDMAITYASEYGLKIVAAILIFVIGKWVVKKLTTITKSLMEKAEIDRTLIEFAESLVYFVLLLMV
ncbi:MAG: mechanosensitive ion channel family protein, partial [Campylobacterota bacterium]|nr:mechanosensitive ion channel family protein [Campylobacterota bacterium]